jgi:hypothetical protein
VSITESKTISQGYFGLNSYVQYRLETKTALPGYDSSTVHIVLRRFSDFEWLVSQLQINEMYKGLIIPLLPEKKIIGNLDSGFVEKRREELESFLRVIATHLRLKFDPQLRAFLTLPDFDKYRVNPSAFQKVMGYVEYLPSVKNLTLASLTEAVQTSIVTVKNELSATLDEPVELKPQTPSGDAVDLT